MIRDFLRGRLAFALFAAPLALTACAETQLGAQIAKSAARGPATPPVQTASADPALAPEVFETTGLTIWDGASTLQGVWVAHPLALRAQRVRIINRENGLVTEGAMFKRDPALSGPSILVSSDAARSLGLTPGEPTELQLTALREGPPRQRVAAVGAEDVAEELPPAGADAVDDGDEPATIETAALAAPESPAVDAVAPATDGAANEAVDAEGVEEAEIVTTGAEIDESAPEIETAAATAEEPPTPSEATPPAVTATEAPAQAAEETTTTAAAPVITEEASAPAPAPRGTQPPPETTTAAAVSPSPTPREESAQAIEPIAPSEVKPDRGSLPRGVYVQAGAFGVEDNAKKLVSRLRNRGLPARYVLRGSSTKLSVVMIGPLDPAEVRAARAAAIREGVADAQKVTL